MNGNNIIEWLEDNYELVYDTIKENYPELTEEEIDNDSDLQYDTAMSLLF